MIGTEQESQLLVAGWRRRLRHGQRPGAAGQRYAAGSVHNEQRGTPMRPSPRAPAKRSRAPCAATPECSATTRCRADSAVWLCQVGLAAAADRRARPLSAQQINPSAFRTSRPAPRARRSYRRLCELAHL